MKEEDLGVPSLADMLACPTQFRSINSVASTTSTPLKLLSGHSHSHSHSQNTTITTSINNNGNTNTTSNKNNNNNKGNGNEAIVAGGGGGRGGTGGGGGEVLQCPRCESFNTKFCYYNNYSLSQPRHYCKNCKRYWTRGGTLRTVPIGGACRKNNPSKPDKSRTPPPSHGTSTAITTHTATMPLSSTDLFTGASSSSSSGFLSLLLGGGGGSGNGMDPNETLLDQFSYGHPRSAPFPETLDMFPKEEALHSGPDTSGEECRAASASEAFTGYTESTPKPFSSTFPWKQKPPRAPMDIGSPLQSNNPPPGSFINNHTSLKRSMLMMLEDDGSMQDEEQKKKLASSPGNEAVPLLLDWQVPPSAPSSCVGFFEDSWNDLSHYGYGQGPFT